jgi:hypothetical protein
MDNYQGKRINYYAFALFQKKYCIFVPNFI